MPRYDYRCTGCGATYERRESFDAALEHPCEQCGGPARRVFVAPPILFKGSGWYVTDSKTSGSNSVSQAGKPAEGKPAASGGEPAAGETPAAKGEAAPTPSSS